MRNWCVKVVKTGDIFKVFLTENEFREFLAENPEIGECIECVDCDDAPSLLIE
jgi:hypothetical protein